MISSTFNFITVLILIRIIIPIFAMGGHLPNSPLVKFLYDMGDMFLLPGRVILQKLGIDTGMLDLSPLVSMMILYLIEKILLGLFA